MPPRMRAADVGGYYIRDDGTVWKLVCYTDQPTATLERLEPLFDLYADQPPQERKPRVDGVVGAPIFGGFRRLVPEDDHV